MRMMSSHALHHHVAHVNVLAVELARQNRMIICKEMSTKKCKLAEVADDTKEREQGVSTEDAFI